MTYTSCPSFVTFRSYAHQLLLKQLFLYFASLAHFQSNRIVVGMWCLLFPFPMLNNLLHMLEYSYINSHWHRAHCTQYQIQIERIKKNTLGQASISFSFGSDKRQYTSYRRRKQRNNNNKNAPDDHYEMIVFIFIYCYINLMKLLLCNLVSVYFLVSGIW